MKKLFILALAAVAMSAVSCNEPTEDVEYSLSVETSSLTFEATGAAPQRVAVEAGNVEWECSVPDVYKEWLSVSRDGDAVSVSVTDNEASQPRTGVVSINAVGGKVKGVSVSVAQNGGTALEEYSLKVEPGYLNFVGEEATPQQVAVTATEGMAWSAEPVEDWITVTPGDGGFTVSVADNPDTAERRGTVKVSAGEESVGVKTVNIIQESRRVFDVDDTGEIVFSYNTNVSASKRLEITSVGVQWSVAVEPAAEGGDVSWLEVFDNTTNVVVNATASNTEKEERRAFVVFTTDWDGAPEVRIGVRQEAAKDFYSTLTGNIDLTSGELCNNRVSVYPWEKDDNKGEWTQVNDWNVDLTSAGIEYISTSGRYTGTGHMIKFSLTSSRIEKNEENIYYIPTEQPYTVADHGPVGDDATPYTIDKGKEPGMFYNEFYYLEYADGEVVNYAPIVEGTVTVTRDGDNYTFDIDVKDDFGWTVKATYAGEVRL